MNAALLEKILKRIDQPELIQILTSKLSGTELNSLLLAVFHESSLTLTPAELLANYRKNRFVKPSDLPVIRLREMELDLLKLFENSLFTPIELSPVSAFGSCSAVAPASQHKILTALRGTEVLADATNALALHVADIKSKKEIPTVETIRFSCIQRHLRTQQIVGAGFTPHFKIACLVSSGQDTGNYSFEKQALLEHIHLMTTLYKDYYLVDKIAFRFICREGYPNPEDLAIKVKEHILDRIPATSIDIVNTPEKENNYYSGIQYKIDITLNNRVFEIGDGGFVDWTQKLLQNKKERMLSTGIGFEFMYRIVTGQI